jgi:hypothetical protein
MLQQAGRPRARWQKGPAHVNAAVLHIVAVTATPPPILLLGRARLVESPLQGGNYLPPFIEILRSTVLILLCYRDFCVTNYAHLVYGMQMASAARAWMYRQPQEDWENFLSGVNGFLNQAKADMRNRGV